MVRRGRRVLVGVRRLRARRGLRRRGLRRRGLRRRGLRRRGLRRRGSVRRRGRLVRPGLLVGRRPGRTPLRGPQVVVVGVFRVRGMVPLAGPRALRRPRVVAQYGWWQDPGVLVLVLGFGFGFGLAGSDATVRGRGRGRRALPGAAGAAAATSDPTGGAGASTIPAGAGASTIPAGGGTGGAVSGAVEGASSAAGGTGIAPAGLTGLLDSPGFSAPPAVRTWLQSGGVDPRVVSMLDSILAHHTIGVSNLEVLSTPVHVQSFDIVSVDGAPVGPENFAARDLVTEIAAMDPNVRPDEIGTPWPIQSPGFFTGPSSTNGLHFAFEAPGTNATPGQEAGYSGIEGGQPQPQMNYAIGAQPAVGAAAPLYPGTGPASVQQISPAAVATGTPGAGVVGSVLAAGPSVGSSPHTGPEAVLDYARSMIGKLPESSGPNMGPALDKFEAQYGFHGAPWCGIFAGHALQAAGLKVPHSVASVASILDLARNGDPPFVKGILPISAARPGDLATFGGAEHVAIITKIDAAGVHTIAGNTSQSNVSETIYSPSSVTGVVRPDYALATPGGGAGAGAAPATVDPSAGAAPAVPGAAPAAAGVPGAASAAAAVPGAPPGAVPGTAAEAVPVAATPGTAAFKAAESSPGPPRSNTVQFLPAVATAAELAAVRQRARSRPARPGPGGASRSGVRQRARSRAARACAGGGSRSAVACRRPGSGDRSRAADVAGRYVDPRLSRLARTEQDGGGRRRRQPATGIEPEPGRAGRRTRAMAAASRPDGLVTIRPTEVPSSRSKELLSRAAGADELGR